VTSGDTYPLPEDPALAQVAAGLRDTGHWGWIVDDRWRTVYATDQLRLTFGAGQELASWPLGEHLFGPAAMSASSLWRFGSNTPELMGRLLNFLGGWVLADTPGGIDELREIVDPELRSRVNEITLSDPVAQGSTVIATSFARAKVDVPAFAFRVRESSGRLAGTAIITKPAPGMAVLGAMASMADLGHLERMQSVSVPARRPAAILFADLEASSPLARRLSTASYFRLGRRLVRAADQCVIDEGGLVGRHVGDGVVAFFVAEHAGSESRAARAAIAAARSLRAALATVAERSELQPEEVVLRFGLHWGATAFIGNITTAGRGEVTALGDAVNEAARIEACASGGRALASKELIERLGREDAAALGLDPDRLTYTPLSELDTATEKARRDAPAIAVCEV